MRRPNLNAMRSDIFLIWLHIVCCLKWLMKIWRRMKTYENSMKTIFNIVNRLQDTQMIIRAKTKVRLIEKYKRRKKMCAIKMCVCVKKQQMESKTDTISRLWAALGELSLNQFSLGTYIYLSLCRRSRAKQGENRNVWRALESDFECPSTSTKMMCSFLSDPIRSDR